MTWILVSTIAAALQMAPSPGASSPVQTLSGAAVYAPPAVASAREVRDADKVLCRRSAETGSRLGGVTECATKAQWREREHANADALRQAQSKASQLRP